MGSAEDDDFLHEDTTPDDCDYDAAWVDLVQESLDNQPLYEGSQISDLDSVALLMAIQIEHQATNRLIDDILHLVRRHMPKAELPRLPNHLKSKYYLKKLFLHGKADKIHQHKICHYCSKLLTESDADACTSCKKPTKKTPRYFITIDVASQLNELYKDSSFRSNLDYRKTRKQPENGLISDIYDGKLYKENSLPGGFFDNEDNLSVVWHIDGAQVSKSSHVSIWPIQAVINELPPRMRFTRHRTLLFGLWYGTDKPLLSTYMMSMTRIWNDLLMNGVVVNCGSVRKRVRIKCLAGTMDLPAMSMVKEVKQYNGFYGCGVCEEEGVRAKKGKGTVQTYPYRPERAPQRTHERMKNQAVQAIATNKTVYGVKQRTTLSFLRGFDPAVDIMIDYLHGVCIGVTKAILKLWFNGTKNAYYIGDKSDLIDARLTIIKPPDNLTRNPRSLVAEMANFKGAEYRALLLYYGLVVFKGVLLDKYYRHFAMLSTAVYLLLQDEVTANDKRTALGLLSQFHILFAEYYGLHNCTVNIHNTCTHLVECVDLAGPLWAFGCFVFEGNNATMTRFVHGTRYVGMQVANGYHMLQRIRSLSEVITSPAVNEYLNRVINKRKRNQESPELGCLKRLKDDSEESMVIREQLSCGDAVIHKFARLVKGREILISEDWLRQTTKDSTVVAYVHEGSQRYGRIARFFNVATDTGKFNVAGIIPAIIVHNNGIIENGQPLLEGHQAGNHTQKIRFDRSTTQIIRVESIGRRMVMLNEDAQSGLVIAVANQSDHD